MPRATPPCTLPRRQWRCIAMRFRRPLHRRPVSSSGSGPPDKLERRRKHRSCCLPHRRRSQCFRPDTGRWRCSSRCSCPGYTSSSSRCRRSSLRRQRPSATVEVPTRGRVRVSLIASRTACGHPLSNVGASPASNRFRHLAGCEGLSRGTTVRINPAAPCSPSPASVPKAPVLRRET